jgi:hypothetical protein
LPTSAKTHEARQRFALALCRRRGLALNAAPLHSVLSAAAQALRSSTSSAQADAEVLLARVLGWDRSRLIAARNEPVAFSAQR